MFKLIGNERRLSMAFLIAVLLLATASGQEKQCGDVGAYCLNHWDCCSNSCMNYLYKCVRNYNIYPYPFLIYQQPPRQTIDQILAMNFGTNNYVSPYAAPQPIGAYDRLLSANEIVTNYEDSMPSSSPTQSPVIIPIEQNAATTITNPSPTPVFQTASRLGTVDEIVPITTATNASSSTTQNSPENMTPAAVETVSTMTSNTTATPPASCSAIGVKCFRNEECCSERCHGFLHQCVT